MLWASILRGRCGLKTFILLIGRLDLSADWCQYPPHYVNRVLVPSLAGCRNVIALKLGCPSDGTVTLIECWYILRAMQQLECLEISYLHVNTEFLTSQLKIIEHLQPQTCLPNLKDLGLRNSFWVSQEGFPLSRFFGTSVAYLKFHWDMGSFPRLEKLNFMIYDNNVDSHAASTWWETQIRHR
ncbi:hypothetical protein C8Q78DRAFT_748654 [Trametes maxima]|nr:hypothetical protein C8Q78DRAFT_748654 [Trametes maxima]